MDKLTKILILSIIIGVIIFLVYGIFGVIASNVVSIEKYITYRRYIIGILIVIIIIGIIYNIAIWSSILYTRRDSSRIQLSDDVSEISTVPTVTLTRRRSGRAELDALESRPNYEVMVNQAVQNLRANNPRRIITRRDILDEILNIERRNNS